VADLFGRRMVTSHESGEGGHLREDVVKQLTGGDKVKARFMRADFFEFDPTHKLQLLTNHKPSIRGSDNGIWRRVLLVPYLARFASVEEVAAGRAHYLKDTKTAERLRGELQGVLTWIVEGARAWAQDGLQPPDAVLAASKDYQTEQDRVGQFIAECCELDPNAEVALADAFLGVYPAYKTWCAEGGFFPLSKQRLVQELERCVPNFAKRSIKQGGRNERRREVLHVRGLRVLES
jgi:putative DNA primase/helicase